ncbi:BTAD domain-containing putative transcriptional regulator [Streptomyces phyllanthi]|uniref:Tetratricopeptide repeat protein n=1 Tax=Streptomyces phyllanthi TaxID=1803180 RepID=A0A5N8WBQ1_9ACTN|nr:BTAD domain-containing putative transcriptional regulator [Streptomyces phyllanthi]MPY44907.1 tetratricopeptide repeat protein [Streptomyces phyllanthi]
MANGRREVVAGPGKPTPGGKAAGRAMRDEPRFGPRGGVRDEASAGVSAGVSTGAPGGLRFGLLGPPVLYDDRGDVLPIGGGKMRALFVALLLEPGRVVSVETLKDALWRGSPPPSAQASLQNHVTRLRRLLDDPERLRAVAPGYQLRVGAGELDVRVFEGHVAAARSAHADRDWARTRRETAAALALWRGAPLGGLPEDIGGQALVQRLEEARLLVLEWRYEAELGLAAGGAGSRGAGDLTGPGAGSVDGTGPVRLAALAPELAALVAEHPLREAFHRLLMLVLHRTGRQAEALAVHRDLRIRLVEELGVEPGAAVRDAHLEILQEETADEPPHGSAGPDGYRPPSSEPPRPAQLPPSPAHFTGRAETLAALRRALDTGPVPDGRASTVALVSGMAGVGKSALALHAAHELAGRFPDGQLYVNLHGATPGVAPLSAGQALASLLRDLGTDPRRIPDHPDAAAALLRSTLAPTRTLMVLDDAAHAAQVRPLLPAGAGCAVIVTSRSPLTALDGAHRFPLAPLSGEDSAALLRAVSGRDGLDGTHPLVELTGRLPLALRVVAARLAARRALTPDALAGQLAATEGRLNHLEYDDLSVRRSLAVAHDALRVSAREADRDAALVLHRIGALDLPAYGAALIAHLTGTGEHRAEAALDRLVDVALLEETSYGRYAPHDLVRDFARELAESGGSAGSGRSGGSGEPGTGDGADVVRGDGIRVAEDALRWYADRARQSLVALLPPGYEREERLRPTAGEPDPVDTRPFPSAEAAFAWGDRELPNIVALVERCARPDGTAAAPSPLVPVLVRHLFPYLHRGGRLAELDTLGRIALDVARSVGDDAAEAFALTDRAGLFFLAGRLTEALTLNDEGLELWRGLGAVSCIRRCLNNRGLLLESLHRYQESEEALRQSLELSRQLCDPYGQAVTFSHLGNLYEHTDPRAAIIHHRRSLALADVSDSVLLKNRAHCNIGYAHLKLGEPDRAVQSFEQSRAILGDEEDWAGESQTRLGLVRALRARDDTERAVHECGRLLKLAERRADLYMTGLARHQRGLLLAGEGRTEEARREWKAALETLDGTDSPMAGELRGLLADED